jgi:hypothetical protein
MSGPAVRGPVVRHGSKSSPAYRRYARLSGSIKPIASSLHQSGWDILRPVSIDLLIPVAPFLPLPKARIINREKGAPTTVIVDCPGVCPTTQWLSQSTANNRCAHVAHLCTRSRWSSGSLPTPKTPPFNSFNGLSFPPSIERHVSGAFWPSAGKM